MHGKPPGQRRGAHAQVHAPRTRGDGPHGGPADAAGIPHRAMPDVLRKSACRCCPRPRSAPASTPSARRRCTSPPKARLGLAARRYAMRTACASPRPTTRAFRSTCRPASVSRWRGPTASCAGSTARRARDGAHAGGAGRPAPLRHHPTACCGRAAWTSTSSPPSAPTCSTPPTRSSSDVGRVAVEKAWRPSSSSTCPARNGWWAMARRWPG